MPEQRDIQVTWETADGLTITTPHRLNLVSGHLPTVLDRPMALRLSDDDEVPESVSIDAVRRRYELVDWGPWQYTRYATYREVPPRG